MIAQVRILLPFSVWIPEGATLNPIEVKGLTRRVVIHAPQQAEVVLTNASEVDPATPLVDTRDRVVSRAVPDFTDAVKWAGARTLRANLLEVDIHGDFDRTAAKAQEIVDPLVNTAFMGANSLLLRIRSAAHASRISPVARQSSRWSLEFLSDSGDRLPEETGLFRSYHGKAGSFTLQFVTEAVWEKARSLPSDYEAPRWSDLLLDANSLAPQIGPSLVLASAAIETAIATTLNHLALSSTLPAGLWDWINDRDGDYRKEPSVQERCDVLLKALSGKSLKEEKHLWQAFKEIKEARNNFVHEGKAMIGEKPVSEKQASNLLLNAAAIIQYFENLLPESLRRPIAEATPLWEVIVQAFAMIPQPQQ